MIRGHKKLHEGLVLCKNSAANFRKLFFFEKSFVNMPTNSGLQTGEE